MGLSIEECLPLYPFVSKFLKIKQENSGFPRECVTEEEKREYVKMYEERKGIKLEIDNIEKIRFTDLDWWQKFC